MSLTSISDQSHQFITRRLTGHLRREIDRLTLELGTGRKKLAATPTSGDLAQILSLRREMIGLTAYRTAATEAQILSKTAQTVLEQVSKSATDASTGMVAAGLSRSGAEIASAAADARVRFSSVVTSLNSQAAGQSLFAGIATDRPALAAPEVMLTSIEAAIAGHTTAADVKSAIETWFTAAGGGFESTALLGSTTPLGHRIGASDQVTLPVTAADPALRQVLIGLAMASFAPQLADVGEQAKLMESAGTKLIDAGADVIALRASLGAIEARIDQRSIQLASQQSALQLVEAELLGVDQYETSVALEASATRLETLYTVTTRLSRLTLADFLR